ncbi:MAG: DNA primase [uncultured Sphingomonadaceae bacterium]|uniref:DNA primase n=1 Tax=uncultured Sphingomonadaceae bacterium TaxID=169976 RepID=A0A6J4SU27_9SPHN|nr:MAG: DNA primase [uncultured Sphingomonadaceae bacterium]
MTLSPQFLDELRSRTLLSGLIARTVKLTRAGREWKACCPFHNEKSPSFYVNDEKGFYHCFGCSQHGDAISWMTEKQGLPFMDAVKELAEAAGIDVPAGDPRHAERARQAETLYDVMAAAADWFAEQLAGGDGAGAREYLNKRGFGAATQKAFRFGFAPDSRGRLKAALARFGNAKLVEAGLLIQPEDATREPYDRFRGRLMIPIRDRRGRVIAFGGRIIGEGEPKYLNSPETPLFDKGRSLFNLDRAAAASRAAGRLVLVEGFLDAVSLDQAGVGEAVAPLGTAVTEAQLEAMWRLSPSPILCFDGDGAGQKAMIRAALRALPGVGPGRTLRFATLPAGQDPDDIVRAGGKEAFEALLEGAEPLAERLWRHEQEAEPLGTPEARAGLKARLMDHVGTIADRETREQYRAEWLRGFNELTRPAFAPRPPFNGRRAWQRPGTPPPPAPAGPGARSIHADGIDAPTARAVLTGLRLFPQALHDHCEAVAGLQLADPGLARVRDHMMDACHAEVLDRDQLHAILMQVDGGASIRELNRPSGLAFSFTRRDAPPERALRDLVLVIEALAERPLIDAALAAATGRLEAGDEAAWAEQTTLRMLRDKANDRLAELAQGEADARLAG